jgi:hypothetical protein
MLDGGHSQKETQHGELTINLVSLCLDAMELGNVVCSLNCGVVSDKSC